MASPPPGGLRLGGVRQAGRIPVPPPPRKTTGRAKQQVPRVRGVTDTAQVPSIPAARGSGCRAASGPHTFVGGFSSALEPGSPFSVLSFPEELTRHSFLERKKGGQSGGQRGAARPLRRGARARAQPRPLPGLLQSRGNWRASHLTSLDLFPPLQMDMTVIPSLWGQREQCVSAECAQGDRLSPSRLSTAQRGAPGSTTWGTRHRSRGSEPRRSQARVISRL